MDEPTVGIDPQSRNRIFESIEEINKQGRTVLYTTHYMEEAMRLCNCIAIMDGGEIIVQGDPEFLVKENGTSRIVFEIGESAASVTQKLKEIDGIEEVCLKDRQLVIKARVKDGTIDLVSGVKALVEGGGTTALLRSITEPTLESLFLDLTGRRLRDDV
jgi:ABC-2 type transport system ATP-binding protein